MRRLLAQARALYVPEAAEVISDTLGAGAFEAFCLDRAQLLVPAINGLSDARLPRDAFLEAFVYSTILGEIHREGSPLHARIRSALGLAESLDLSVDDETAVARAQGVAWATLRESPELRASLIREHERVGGLLPLEIDFLQPAHP
jgi:hypothetical protein